MKIGTTDLGQSGIGLRALAVLDASTRHKPNGVTIDWDKVNPLQAGRNQKYSLVVDGDDGTFTATVGANTTAALDHDVAVAALETALEGLASVGAGNVLVTGTPENYVIEFVEDLREQPVVMTVDDALITGGGAAATLTQTQLGVVEGEATLLDGTVVAQGDKYIELGTVLAKVTATGKYAPADTTASDGRQTVDGTVRGERFVLDRPLIKSIDGDYAGDVFDAGIVFKSRLQIGGAYTGAPTEANFETMFPAVTFHTD